MNPTQWQTSFASVISFVAGLAAGRGLFGWDQATWVTILTALVGAAGAVYAAIAARKTALVTTVANLPEVKEIKVTSTAAGSALAASTPPNVN